MSGRTRRGTRRPIFIVGAQRSGTTLVRLLLDAHPAISIGPETSFLRNVAQGAARAAGEDRTRVREDAYAIGRDGIEAELAAAWGRVFDHHARANGAVRWGEKSPVHRYHGARIKRLFPDAQVIAVVRHPAAVCLSRIRWGYAPAKTASDWAASVRHHLGDAERFGPRRFHLLRYEDLLTETRVAMESVLAFLDEPWDEAVLDHTHGVQEGTRTDGGTVMSEPLDPGRALAWTADIADEILAELAANAAEEMALVGYAAERAHPVAPLPDSALTAPPSAPRAALAARRALAQRGPADLARRALADVRERGPFGAVRRWRRL